MSDTMTRAADASATWEYDPMLGRPRVVHRPPNAADSPSVAAQQPLSPELLDRMQRYWNAANYLTVGQIYLTENPLLREPLRPEQIKQRLLGHWGTSTGLSFIYVHLNRLIQESGADVIYIAGPGHGGPALNAHSYLEGTYAEVHPEITQDAAGIRLLFRQFSTPGGVPSHAGPHTPNSLHEGGELGYALVHAYGAAFDNPELIVACVIGDGEAETGPLEGSWKGNKFLNPVRDGAVLPILHLNGYKIAGPTVLARIEPQELTDYFLGHGYYPYFVEGDDPPRVHQWFAATFHWGWLAQAEPASGQPHFRRGLALAYLASRASSLNYRVQFPKLDAGIGSCELPVHAHLPLVAFVFPGRYFAP